MAIEATAGEATHELVVDRLINQTKDGTIKWELPTGDYVRWSAELDDCEFYVYPNNRLIVRFPFEGTQLDIGLRDDAVVPLVELLSREFPPREFPGDDERWERVLGYLKDKGNGQ